MAMLLEYKELIEGNPLALATVMSEGTPNVIGVAYAKVVDDTVVITDNFMNQTIKDIQTNNKVCLVVWDRDMRGCKIVGEARYHTEGKWREFVQGLEENKGFAAKGAIVVKVLELIPSKG